MSKVLKKLKSEKNWFSILVDNVSLQKSKPKKDIINDIRLIYLDIKDRARDSLRPLKGEPRILSCLAYYSLFTAQISDKFLWQNGIGYLAMSSACCETPIIMLHELEQENFSKEKIKEIKESFLSELLIIEKLESDILGFSPQKNKQPQHNPANYH